VGREGEKKRGACEAAGKGNSVTQKRCFEKKKEKKSEAGWMGKLQMLCQNVGGKMAESLPERIENKMRVKRERTLRHLPRGIVKNEIDTVVIAKQTVQAI